MLVRVPPKASSSACFALAAVIATPVFPTPSRGDGIVTRASSAVASTVQYGTDFLFFLWELFLDSMRAMQLGLVFAPVAISYPLSLICNQTREVWTRMFTSALKWAGPTFIKLGQWASTRPDLFPNDICNELSLLHECAGSGSNMSFPATCSLLKQTIGMDVEDVFFSFEPEPCGSGCIATVYRASVVPLGEQIPVRVAVKVIRPGVRRKVMRDIRLMRRVVSILYTLCNLVPDGASVQWLSLREACEQFETFMLSQLDMRDEANNLLKFRENFAGDPCIRFPKPLFEVMTHDGGVCNLSHPDVLVETFQDGVSLSAFLRSPLAADIPLCRSLAQQGVRAFLQMTLRDNFVHADLHPGNIIVNDDTLSFIDAGLVTTLTPSDKENFLLLFTAVAKKDGRSAARHMLERSRGVSVQIQEVMRRRLSQL